MVDRELKDTERLDTIKNGVEPYEYRVAMDALAAVVNAKNPVNALTMKQVMGIYIGTIKPMTEQYITGRFG